MAKLLALGDCNTLGIAHFTRNTYAERFAKRAGLEPVNCGCTMSTTREGMRYFADNFDKDCAVITIQYGLVDSWRTFRYAPYVLYYPDNPLRKIGRKLVKKWKSTARRRGWNDRFGVAHVVPPLEYRANIEFIIAAAPAARVYLIDTAPHMYPDRNPFIEQYNQSLVEIAAQYENTRHVAVYDRLASPREKFTFDGTHLNETGHDVITDRLLTVHQQS